MCWSTKNKNNATPIVAEKDIKVYKVLTVTEDSISSPCQYFEWELGVLHEEDIKVNTTGIETYINNGFHSLKFPPFHLDGFWYNGDKKLFKKLFRWGKYDVVFEAIIPKDSVYYENEDGEIVSTALKLKEIYMEKYIKNRFKELCCQEKK